MPDDDLQYTASIVHNFLKSIVHVHVNLNYRMMMVINFSVGTIKEVEDHLIAAETSMLNV